MIILLALAIGIVAGLRTMTAPAAVSIAAATGAIHLGSGPFAFLGYRYAPWIVAVAALGELVVDKLPSTPSRKTPPGFIARIVSGAVSGAALASTTGHWLPGLAAGIVGAVLGTLGGASVRRWLAIGFARDWPAALIEDAVAILAALIIVWMAA